MHFMASFKTCNTEGEKSRKPRCPPSVVSLGSKQISSKPQVRRVRSRKPQVKISFDPKADFPAAIFRQWGCICSKDLRQSYWRIAHKNGQRKVLKLYFSVVKVVCKTLKLSTKEGFSQLTSINEKIWVENSVSAIYHTGNRKNVLEVPPPPPPRHQLILLHAVVVLHYKHHINKTCLIKGGKAVEMLKNKIL